MKTPGSGCEERFRGPKGRGVSPRRSGIGRDGNSGAGPNERRTMNSPRVRYTTQRGRSRPENCLTTLYAFAADGASRQGMRVQSSDDSVTDALYAGFLNLEVPPELDAKLSDWPRRRGAQSIRLLSTSQAAQSATTSGSAKRWEKGRVAVRRPSRHIRARDKQNQQRTSERNRQRPTQAADDGLV